MHSLSAQRRDTPTGGQCCHRRPILVGQRASERHKAYPSYPSLLLKGAPTCTEDVKRAAAESMAQKVDLEMDKLKWSDISPSSGNHRQTTQQGLIDENLLEMWTTDGVEMFGV